MNRAHLLERLAMVEQHIAERDMRVSRQREILAELEVAGRDGTAHRKLLATFLHSQTLFIADRDRILAELAASAAPSDEKGGPAVRTGKG